jgi:tagatose-1,6-bisphosphate aldolase non-catalytic subunit AgaZ/GatZ
MNADFRKQAKCHDVSVVDHLLQRIKEIEKETGQSRTLFAACPNSLAVIRAALRAAKRNNAPIKFAATLNQVDLQGGYTGLDQYEFVKIVRREAEAINFNGLAIIAIDHGGPWLKDIHTREKWSYEDSMRAVKKSFEAAVAAGYDLIHVDPTIDITLPKGEIIDIDTVVARTIDLIVHTERFRREHGFDRIAYEVGTEEVHGGLADMKVFSRFLQQLRKGLEEKNLADVWPCFVVGKVGTDLHTSTFDPVVASHLSTAAAEYGSVIKGHYSDNVTNPEEYPAAGMGAANVGPEFTEREYEGLMELVELEKVLFSRGRVPKQSQLKEVLWHAVIKSNRWQKWLLEGETADNFYANIPDRQLWLIKTGCRYIWENAEVIAARTKLYRNLAQNGTDAEEILLLTIEKAMDKYFHKFNLVDLNSRLLQEELISTFA